MKKIIIISSFILFLGLFAIPGICAPKIVVVKSSSVMPYSDVLKGYREILDTNFKEFDLSDENSHAIINYVHNEKPDLIFTIGQNALNSVKDIRDIPIVYAMVSSPQRFLSDENNITGISMNISAYSQLNDLLKILPRARKVGIVYDTQKTGQLFTEVRDALVNSGLSVHGQAIDKPEEAPVAIDSMGNEIDVFWMLPDTTVLTKETLEYLFLFSIEKGVPVLAFSDKYLGMGALLTLTIDAEDIGRQAGELSYRVLSGDDVSMMRIYSPRKSIVSINFKIIEKLGIDIDKGTQKKIDLLYKRELK